MLPYLATNVPGNTIYHHNETCCLYWFAITPPCLGLASTPSSPTLYSVEAVPAPALPAEVGLLLQNAKTYFNPESGVQARIIKSNAVDQQTPVFWISIYEEKMCEKCDPRGQRRPGLVTRFALQMTPRTWDQWTLGDGGHWRGWGQWG